MKSYPKFRLILSSLFVLFVLMLLFSPQWLLSVSPYIGDTRHLLIAGTGILFFIGDQAAMRRWAPDSTIYCLDESVQNSNSCQCPC